MNRKEGLDRFVSAQERDYAVALSEIKNGKKRSHWMWYIFPQIQGLGYSETSKYYAIQNLAEADAFLHHPVLGARLLEISKVLLTMPENNATRIFGSPDDVKLQSSMTLFSLLKIDPVFDKVLDKFYKGEKDQQTVRIAG